MEDTDRKQGYLLEDFRLFHLRGVQGVQSVPHYHEFHKLLLLLSGCGSYWIEGQRYQLSPGDVVLVGRRCVHRPEFESTSPYERIILYISPEFLRRAAADGCDLTDCFSGLWGHVFRPEQHQARRLEHLAVGLERELSGSDYGRAILCSALLLRLLIQLARDLHREGACLPAPVMPDGGRIGKMIQYLDSHLTEDVSVDRLAEAFYLSKYHMMRLFRQETGFTVWGYLTNQRLLLAKSLMEQGLAATEACFRSGFRCYSSFVRAYAKHFGTTPTGRPVGGIFPEESDE